MTRPFFRQIRPQDLPMPQGQAMQLMQYALRDDAKIPELTRLVSLNPGLTAQMLSLVNSAFFSQGRQSLSLSDALVVLGLDRLKHLVLCFVVKEALSQKPIPKLDMDQFWTDSLFRGTAARQLGILANCPPDQAFTAGMLQDTGLLALFALEPDKADRWPLLRVNSPHERLRMENALFQATHDQVGRLITEKWGLPRPYAAAIGSHHLDRPGPQGGDQTEETLLTVICHLADLCCALFTCHDKARVLRRLEQQADQLLGLNTDQVLEILSALPDQVAEAAGAMNLSPVIQTDFPKILDLAAQRLVSDSLDFQELTWKLQQALKERDEYAARLEGELDAARLIQSGLLPNLDTVAGAAAFNLPALHLSGDFYDYLSLDAKTVSFCLGDVSGKGTAAALLMSKAISLFRWLSKAKVPLETLVAELNREIYETSVKGMFVSLAAGRLNLDTQTLSLVNLGHPPPVLVGEKKVIQIHASAPPLGVLPAIEARVRTFSLNQRRLFLYSDGFIEGRLKERPDKALGVKGFLGWLIESNPLGAKAQAQWIQTRAQETLKDRRDDLTLLILTGRD